MLKAAGILLFLSAGAITLAAAAKFDISGDAQYRLRFEQNDVHAVSSTATVDSLKYDYTNRYAWNLKATVTAAENLMFGIRLSNPSGSSSDNIADNLKAVGENGYNILAVPEFYFKWSYSLISLSAGIIPVAENTVLNLALYENNGYLNAGADPWSVRMNNSQKGIFLETRCFQNAGNSVGVNLLWVSAADSGASLTQPAEQQRRDQFRFMAAVPFVRKALKLSVMPVFHLRTNISQAGDKTDHAYAAGLDLGVTPFALLDLRTGFAYGFYKNSAVAADTTIRQVEPSGIIGSMGCNVRPGYGAIQADITYGQSEENLQAPGKINRMVFGDIKYGMPVKTLTIMPRFRAWYTTNSKDENSRITLRPELILKAGF
jgi:hypothetical protein